MLARICKNAHQLNLFFQRRLKHTAHAQSATDQTPPAHPTPPDNPLQATPPPVEDCGVQGQVGGEEKCGDKTKWKRKTKRENKAAKCQSACTLLLFLHNLQFSNSKSCPCPASPTAAATPRDAGIAGSLYSKTTPAGFLIIALPKNLVSSSAIQKVEIVQ
ncbi:hypothetical protein K438DRAFT_1771166 [Mycena galopus ATCC 62051]|nr:hypothetical protein K438DRAFT_1771166 [Mycena galopus ATCC 62051]